MLMKKSTLTMLLALAPLIVQPACAPDEEGTEIDEHVATSREALLGGSKILWPMQDGKATVRVCWLPLDLGGVKMPGGAYAVDASKTIAERKQWMREGVEREWNAKTVLSFVGWQDCGPGVEADVMILPGGSSTPNDCGSYQGTPGGSCVQATGAPVKGKKVTINTMFGDEALGEARYVQTVTKQTLDNSKVAANGIISPALCGEQMGAYVNHFVNGQTVTAADIALITSAYKDCLQNQTNHEFGHLAGFSHEQDRADTSAACRAKYPAATHDAAGEADTPLGAWEEDSIMSYCRTTLPATLTAQDVQQTNAFYEMLAPKLPSAKPKNTETTQPGDPGSTEEGGGEEEEPAPPVKKPKRPVAQVEKGGCNGN